MAAGAGRRYPGGKGPSQLSLINTEAIIVNQEQDAAFFRNFTLILVILTLFGVAAAIMGRHFATDAKIDPVQHSLGTP